jgi:VIT1/CCC1 family predicted Fe2+/Mn2+ transporter
MPFILIQGTFWSAGPRPATPAALSLTAIRSSSNSFVASASGAVVPILPFLSSPGAAAIAAAVMICGLGRLFGAT